METPPENITNGHLSLEKLKEALDKSSSINRAIGFTFGIFIFYIAITVAATTDVDLFIPDSGFSVPFLNLKLGVVNFFLAAPFVVLIIHYNLLYNLMQHSKKLLCWHNANLKNFGESDIIGDTCSTDDLDMYPFLFNFALNVENPIHNRTLNIVNRITIFMLPLALLCFILIRFADYQSIPITLWHFVAVMIDAALIATHSFNILKIIKTHSAPIKDEYQFMEFFDFLKQGHRFEKLWKNAKTIIFTAFPAFFACLFSLILTFLVIIYNLLTKFKFRKMSFFKSAISNQVLLYKYLRIETFMVHLAAFFVVFFIYIMIVDVDFHKEEKMSYNGEAYSKLDSMFFMVKIFPYKFQKSILPTLNLREEVLTKSQPEQQLIESHLNRSFDNQEREKVKQEIILEYSKGYLLKGRSFRYADLSETNLTKTDFRQADLTGAKLEDVNIQKVNLYEANLTNALFLNVNLLSADFLRFANFKGADLRSANLQRAYLWSANLQGVILLVAKLQGADLRNTNLQRADLSKAELQGADLSKAELQGAYRLNANLQGADLFSANLQGTNLWSANLQGVDLNKANLKGAALSFANLQGADLWSSNLQGAILDNTKLRGSLFSEDFSYTFLLINEADEISSSIFDDEYFEIFLDSIAKLIPDTTFKTNFRDRMFYAKERYEVDSVNRTLAQRLPNAKIYRPYDLKTESTFFVIRHKIASESKEIAQGMLYGTRTSTDTIFKSLYNDLYKYLKAQHPDYLEGFEYDEEGMERKMK